MKLTEDQVQRYEAGDSSICKFIRKNFNIPEDRYYTISLFPPELRGTVTIDCDRKRVPEVKKISKSDAQD